MVARHDEVADLAAQLGVDLRCGQPRQLALDVERLLAAADPPGVSRLEQLTDLDIALEHGGRRTWLGTAVLVAVHQQAVLAVFLPRAAAEYQGCDGREEAESADNPDYGGKCRVHAGLSVAHAGKCVSGAVRRGTLRC